MRRKRSDGKMKCSCLLSVLTIFRPEVKWKRSKFCIFRYFLDRASSAKKDAHMNVLFSFSLKSNFQWILLMVGAASTVVKDAYAPSKLPLHKLQRCFGLQSSPLYLLAVHWSKCHEMEETKHFSRPQNQLTHLFQCTHCANCVKMVDQHVRHSKLFGGYDFVHDLRHHQMPLSHAVNI